MEKIELLKIIENIKEPQFYNNDFKIINEKTKIIKKIQKKYNLNFSQSFRLYKLEIDLLKKIYEIL